jgi:hypothetical protein
MQQKKKFKTFNFGQFVLIFLIHEAHPIEFHHTIIMYLLGETCVILKTKNCSESYQTDRVNLILCHPKKLVALFV